MSLFWLFGPPNVEKLKIKRDVKRLITALKYQNDEKVRKAAVAALGEIKDPRAVEPLIAILLKNGSSDLRQAVVYALREMDDSRAISSRLIPTLKDKDKRVRKAAVTALELFNWQPDNDTLRALYAVACEDWDSAVKLGAVGRIFIESRDEIPKEKYGVNGLPLFGFSNPFFGNRERIPDSGNFYKAFPLAVRAHQKEDAHFVIQLQWYGQTVGSYSGGDTFTFGARVVLEVTVFDQSTSKIISHREFVGSDPPPRIYGHSLGTSVTGEFPSTDQVRDYLVRLFDTLTFFRKGFEERMIRE